MLKRAIDTCTSLFQLGPTIPCFFHHPISVHSLTFLTSTYILLDAKLVAYQDLQCLVLCNSEFIEFQLLGLILSIHPIESNSFWCTCSLMC